MKKINKFHEPAKPTKADMALPGVILIVIGILWAGGILYTSRPHSFGFIGGADGPTAVYLGGHQYGTVTIITSVIGGILLTIIGIFLICKKSNH